jgi:GntR family transcriptional regulator
MPKPRSLAPKSRSANSAGVKSARAQSGRAETVLANTGTGVSRYKQLATLFRRHIATGHWKVGEQIPTIEELANDYGVARATVRQALDALAGENLIERFRAKGTFVTHHPEEQLWCEVETDWAGLLRARRGATIETLAELAGQQPSLAPDFSGSLARSYRYFRRRHWRNNEPFLLSEMYIDSTVFKHVPKNAISTKTGLQFLSEVPGLELGDFRQTLTIGAADMVTAEMLNLDLNAPVAFMRRYAFDKDNRLVFTGETIYRGDVFWLSMKLKPE